MTGYTIDPLKVVHETVDGETILIHLQTGCYYSLTGSGAEIWTLMLAARPTDEIADELARRHGVDAAEVRSAVEELVLALAHEDLLVPNGVGPHAPPSPAPPVWQGSAWAEPKLEKYDDMQDFLLVDPIHEVDEGGWPNLKATG
jgi:hypothetical protein